MNIRFVKYLALACAMASALSWGGVARAAYPDHVITGVVPFDVGGASDLLARIMATHMSAVLGQTVVIENKGGAAGNVGMSFVAHAKPDGYTLLFTGPGTTQNPAMYRHMPYDPLKDMMGVAEYGEAYYVVAINTGKVPARNLLDFVKLVKDNPGKYNASAGGLGTRLTVEFFRQLNGLNVEILPYNSAGDAATALLTGESDFMIVDPAPLGPGMASGKIKVLAVSGPVRNKFLPDVPTAAEAGLPQYQDFSYDGLYAPSGLPADVVTKLNDAVAKVVVMPDVIAAFGKLGWVRTSKPQPVFQKFYLDEIAKWKKVVSEAKIPPVD